MARPGIEPRSSCSASQELNHSATAAPKELFEHLKSPNLNHITSIKSFDFSTLYTTIPHGKMKSRLASIIRNSFILKKRQPQIQMSTSIGSRRSILCEGTHWLQKQVLWRWHHQDARVSGRRHFRGFCGKSFPADLESVLQWELIVPLF